MSESIPAFCNESCGKHFQITKFETKKHPRGIEETYFKCPHCFHHYTSFVTDSRVRKIQNMIKTMMDNTQTPVSKVKLESMQQEINQRMSLLKFNLINFGRADL